jgi:AraC family transcriptional regulator
MPYENGPREPVARAIASGEGWSISEFVCALGPRDRAIEERFDAATIAAVIDGTFQVRTAAGAAVLYSGSFLLGNPDACFECRHDHGIGDRCVAFHFDLTLFEEIAAAVAGSSRFRFPAAMLPADPRRARPLVESVLQTKGHGLIAPAELAIGIAETVVAVMAGTGGASSSLRPSAQDQRRISAVLRHIEQNFDQPLQLDELAAVACMSKYHFLRTFRRIVGLTPHQFLLDLRMRRAATVLCTTQTPISAIAFDAGFGDLSTFNGRFRDVFGVSPGGLRRSGGGA